ncbi:MAG TPA: AAA family ATPase, partial [Pilimelia sp.]|nr:AAA family ATPase [Pilimelia sp.]
MAPWRFVGRADECERLIASATGGRRGLILTGSVGIGKSRLLREAVNLLPTDRYAVSAAAANIVTAALPLGGVAEILPADQPAGLSPAGLLRWAVQALHQQAAGRPIVLAVDDAHLLDPSSAALVYLIARSDRATVLGTLRSGEPVPLPVRALWTDDLVDYVELRPLTPPESAELLAAMLGGPVDPASAERLWRISAGNPLMLRELVVAGRAGGEFGTAFGLWRWTGRLELAPTLTDMIDARIGQLSPAERTVLELVALGQPIGLPLLVRATDAAAVEAVEERGLIRVTMDDRRASARLAHPLYGEVLRRSAPVSRTRRLLARLADLVEEAGARRRDDLLRVAVWRLDSDTAQDPGLLLAAATQAFGTFDVPLATRLARAAQAAGGGFHAGELLATLLVFADQPDEAAAVLAATRPAATSEARLARWSTARGLVAYWGHGDVAAAAELAAAADRLTDPEQVARLRAFESLMRLHGLELPAAVRLAHAVLDRPAAGAAARSLARCSLAHLQAARGRLDLAAGMVAAVTADAPQWRGVMPYVQIALELTRGTQLSVAGDVAGIDAIAAEEFADLSDAGDFRLGSGYLAVLRAQAARLRGHSGAALRCAVQACALLATGRVFAGLAHAERAYAAALRGEAASAARAMAESDRVQAPTMAILYPWREQARCWVAACAGRLPTAVAGLTGLAGRLRADGLSGHEVAALHDIVRLGGAATVAARLAELAKEVDGPLAPLAARHARAAATGNAGELLAVAAGFSDLGLRLYAAEATALAVATLRAARDPAVGAAAARLAVLLESCDARTPALAAAAPPPLTGRELQVATLAAGGASSR